MAETEPSRAVLDAGPLIHLDELDCLDLLEGFAELHAPTAVWHEVQFHRPQIERSRLSVLILAEVALNLTPALSALSRSLELDAGEIRALSLLEQSGGGIFLCDDAAARLAAESLGFQVRGTVGLIVRAIRRGTRTVSQVRQTLLKIPTRSTLHLSRTLLAEVVRQIPDR